MYMVYGYLSQNGNPNIMGGRGCICIMYIHMKMNKWPSSNMCIECNF